MAYTIKEVATLTGISAHTLRFYEKEGVAPVVARDGNGNRTYDEQTLEWLGFVLCLRATGMPLAAIKRYIELYKRGDGTISERKEIMRSHKEKVEKEMMHLYSCLEKINYKLALYDVREKELQQRERLPV
jgi:DNA-binding transcriptional MerR regulator